MADACGCSSPRDLIRYMVDVVKDEPATYLYSVGDETPADRHDAMAANSRLIGETDPMHPRFYVSMEQSGFGANLEPFADDADVLAGDVYPVGVTNHLGDVGDATRAVRRIADSHGRQAAMVLQAFSWGPEYSPRPERWPTPAEYRTMRDLALANGRPSFLLWWAAYVIFRANDAEQRWRDLVDSVFAPFPDPSSPNAGVPTTPGQPSQVTGDTTPQPMASAVRDASATRRGRVIRVRFALTRPAPTRITARYDNRRQRRIVQGTTSLQAVRITLAERARRVVIRVRPFGGTGRRLTVV